MLQIHPLSTSVLFLASRILLRTWPAETRQSSAAPGQSTARALTDTGAADLYRAPSESHSQGLEKLRGSTSLVDPDHDSKWRQSTVVRGSPGTVVSPLPFHKAPHQLTRCRFWHQFSLRAVAREPCKAACPSCHPVSPRSPLGPCRPRFESDAQARNRGFLPFHPE